MRHFYRYFRRLWLMEYFADFNQSQQQQQQQQQQPLFQPAPFADAVVSSTSLVPSAQRSLVKMARRLRLPSPDWTPPVQPSHDLNMYSAIVRNAITAAFNALPVPLPCTRNVSGRAVGKLLSMLQRKELGVALADKNAGVVAVSPHWYDTEAKRQLADTAAYLPVTAAAAKALICESLRQLAMLCAKLDASDRDFLLQAKEKSALPYFYLLVKMHKSPVVGRPIVSWHGFSLAPASAWVDAQLQPLLRLESSVLVSSNALVSALAHAPADQRQCWLVTADVASLYTVMPHDVIMAALSWFLTRHARAGNFSRERISTVLAIVKLLLASACFTFGDSAFKQVTGIAMGTNSGPSIANVVMIYSVDRPVLNRFGKAIGFFRRFIDDLFARVVDRQTAVELRDFLSSLLPWLRFSVTLHDQCVEFMDLCVFKAPGFESHGVLSTAIHFKSVSRHMYLPFNSHHPRHCFSGLVVGELIRAAQLCSRPSDFIDAQQRLFAWLSLRGYPAWFLRKWFARVSWAKRSVYGTQAKANAPLVCTMPYTPSTRRLRWQHLLAQSWSLLTFAPSRPVVAWTIPRRLGAIFSQ
ncbi:MAG: hypothetical protein ACYCOR_21460 [Acidobacteriaceae bacterium]